MSEPRPNLFLVGLPRTGTTQLYRYFQSHPQVFTTWYKELLYLGEDLEQFSRLTPKAYDSLFAGSQAYAYRLDASSQTILSDQAPEAIARRCPDARILIGIREPRAWIMSLYDTLAAWQEESRPLHAALDERPSWEKLPRASGLRQHDYWQNTLALPVRIGRYQALFGREHVFIYTLDALQADPHALVHSVCGWLGISPEPLRELYRYERAAIRYWPRVPECLAGRRRRQMEQCLQHHTPWLAPYAQQVYFGVRGLCLRALNGSSGQCPLRAQLVLEPAKARQLLTMLEQLEPLCGKDLTAWREGL